jgi:hypothetical protein
MSEALSDMLMPNTELVATKSGSKWVIFIMLLFAFIFITDVITFPDGSFGLEMGFVDRHDCTVPDHHTSSSSFARFTHYRW